MLHLSKKYKIDTGKTRALKKKIADVVKKDVLKAIEESQKKFQCDYLYFYKYFRGKYNTEYKNMNWNNKYKEAKFNIEINTDIISGNLVNFN